MPISILLPRKDIFSIAACAFMTEKTKPALELMFRSLKAAGIGRQPGKLKGMCADGEDYLISAFNHPNCFPGVQTWLCDYHNRHDRSNAVRTAGTAYSNVIQKAITELVEKMRVS